MNDHVTADRAAPDGRPNSSDTALWIVLIFTALVNGALSLIGLDLLAGPFGVVAAVCGIALIVRYVRRRRN